VPPTNGRVETRRSPVGGWERERRIAMTVAPETALAAIETGTPVVRIAALASGFAHWVASGLAAW
jgi:hypothetical protein